MEKLLVEDLKVFISRKQRFILNAVVMTGTLVTSDKEFSVPNV
ncbi:MAG TPA: hypothetical protein VFC58_16635 [Desulfosporosinus sp.]|nr:hypothetical protein [Desulfosporosinus sp.]